jgi:cytochrome b6-f complex iron-sulfur subunit
MAATPKDTSPRTPQEYEVLAGGGAEAAELARQGLSRRQLLRGVVGVTAGLVLAESVGAGLVFIYPTLVGAFGGKITLQAKTAYAAAKPGEFDIDKGIGVYYEPSAKSYIMHLAAETPFLLSGSQLSDLLDSENIAKDSDGSYWLAIYQRCVHLGCKFLFRNDCQSFKCPCHGSHYNTDGEWLSGPAPRSNDRFIIDVSGANVVVDTGKLNNTVQHPNDTTRLLSETPIQEKCN